MATPILTKNRREELHRKLDIALDSKHQEVIVLQIEGLHELATDRRAWEQKVARTFGITVKQLRDDLASVDA